MGFGNDVVANFNTTILTKTILFTTATFLPTLNKLLLSTQALHLCL